uniref:Uncharacterized protein n=1 Tax=Caenorhabditis tropicalis TaxID=1561998 RepID=A0A1I7T8X3_9PELO
MDAFQAFDGEMRALFGILCILIIVSSTLFDVDIEVHCDAAVGKWCWSVKLIEADFLVDDIVARTHDHCIISNVSSVAFEREIAYDGWNTDTYEIEVVIEHNCTLYTEGPRLIKRDFGVFPIDRG